MPCAAKAIVNAETENPIKTAGPGVGRRGDIMNDNSEPMTMKRKAIEMVISMLHL
ncbi:MAG: hypothetical protein KAW84_04215 [Thermoplasmata archaeon]|nr:hypothetical protein [Thermoplasmata archaeon]